MSSTAGCHPRQWGDTQHPALAALHALLCTPSHVPHYLLLPAYFFHRGVTAFFNTTTFFITFSSPGTTHVRVQCMHLIRSISISCCGPIGAARKWGSLTFAHQGLDDGAPMLLFHVPHFVRPVLCGALHWRLVAQQLQMFTHTSHSQASSVPAQKQVTASRLRTLASSSPSGPLDIRPLGDPLLPSMPAESRDMSGLPTTLGPRARAHDFGMGTARTCHARPASVRMCRP